jgi:subtilisin family serine protease
MSRKIASAIMLVAILIAAVGALPTAAQGPGNLQVVAPLTPTYTVSSVEKGIDKGIIGAPEGFDPREMEVLSIIVTFDESVDANALAAVSGGRVVHTYDKVFKGASLVLSGSKVDAVAAMPGVTGVYYDQVLQIDTEMSPRFIGAGTFWREGVTGEGVVIGVLDTGIWPEHPSFADPDPKGDPYPPPPAGPYACEFGNTAWNPDDAPFECNNKLIGAYEFMDTYKSVVGLDPNEFDSARDSDGHGTHTTSTAGGNNGVEADIFGIPRGYVSGIAPRAHVIMYRVCGGIAGSCYTSDSAAAVEQAILDGVDALNFSIGGGNAPFSDLVSLAFMSAYENGVFVACSAGNSGPGADTVGHREPWTTTVGASTTSRHFISTITLTDDPDDPDKQELVVQGASVTDGMFGPDDLVLAADYGDGLCLEPFPPDTFEEFPIVVCERGEIARVAKSYNVAAGGAGGMILYNADPAQGLSTDNHFIPSVQVTYDVGMQILDFMATYAEPEAEFTQGEATDVQGDVMASFSSRGGPGQTLGISKPDVTAPGVQILAGNTPDPAFPGHPDSGAGLPGELFQSIQGTSMSSPHVAGAGALIKAQHPDWTPGQIKSALMLTAKRNKVFKEDGVTPGDSFDFGSGRINMSKAFDPRLTIDASAADYVAHEHDLWNANYPSLFHPNMPGQLTVQRTVKNITGRGAAWLLKARTDRNDWRIFVPDSVVVAPGGEATFDITIDARNVPQGEVRFGEIQLFDVPYSLHIPVTFVRGMPELMIDKECDPDTGEDNRVACTVTIENTSLDDANINVFDGVPRAVRVDPARVVGATQTGPNTLEYAGFLAGAGPPVITVGAGSSPYGYFSLASLGITPVAGVGDETIVNFTTDPFLFAGVTYTSIGMVTNGYAVVGGGDTGDINYIPQTFPDPAPPNNVIAPLWTDLNGDDGGNFYGAILTDGVNDWVVLEWEDVPEWSSSDSYTFQIWLEANSGVEDISMVYARIDGDGDPAGLNVGAENEYGTSGDNWGAVPVLSDEIKVIAVPGTPGDSHTIYFEADGMRVGPFTNCAEMTADTFDGVAIDCADSEVLP